ncbi:uncharacterized protein N7483_011063 [Penicillium malachiteum]|uniref:uncharacterized protein n=1 Tax=Penicillium malachiteum TaxID=1324776 RepID=UPI002546D582|nr:uncharacterized protein N7483_011063 [Penicillium malachiteum]KAJ5713882.1 hypothetical protein N7483_011063 [Penicillium malachiteum]
MWLLECSIHQVCLKAVEILEELAERFFAWIAFELVYNALISPLRSYPGPKLWAISNIPSSISILRGKSHLDMLKLHEKYGSVVRIGPDELSFNSAQAFQDIYGFRPGKPQLAKDFKLYGSKTNGIRDSIAGYLDNEAHTRQRRLLSHAFSDRCLREQEEVIVNFIDLLISRLRERTQIGPDNKAKEDIKSWFNFVTFDITGDLMFAETFDCLKDSRLHPWISLIFATLKGITFIAVLNHFTILRKLQEVCIPESVRKQMLKNFNLSAQKADRRLEKGTSRPDFMSAILKHGLSDEKERFIENQPHMRREEIHSNSVFITIAGSETSASLLSGCVYYLCMNPNAMAILTQEVRSAFSRDSDITSTKCSRLSYLNAVIEESLRLYPPLVTNLTRIIPDGGDTIDGNMIPGGVTVSTHHYASYHSSANFFVPEAFIPERWLGSDARFQDDKRDVVQPFSLGPRNCLGRNLAYIEIRMILSKLLFNFDLQICKESEDWIDQKVYTIWDKPALMIELHDRMA